MATAPALEAGKLSFSQGFASVSASRDGFSDVSILTGGAEALGHDIFVDETTVDQAVKSLLGRSVPAYLTHGSFFEGDRLTQEVGFYSGFYRDGLKVKARQFNFFSAFTKHHPAKRDMLVELAEKMPTEFGLSIVFSGHAVWAFPDGPEVPVDMDRPEGAFSMPRARIRHIDSADFVKNPAANAEGLFQAKMPAEVHVPAPTPKQATVTTSDGSRTETHVVTVAPVDAAGKGMSDTSAPLSQPDEVVRLSSELELIRAAFAVTGEENKKLTARVAELESFAGEKASEIACLKVELANAEILSAAHIGVPAVAVITEKQALAPAKALSRAEHISEWGKIADAAARRAYWDAHIAVRPHRLI
jgi:hypothetical protein